LNKVKWEILTVTLLSTAIYFTSEYLVDISIPISMGVFLGSAIALLLSFKLSQSYDRWWEARKIWGAIVNDSRSLVIQVKNFSADKDDKLIKKIAYRQMAWCYSLSQTLREQDALENVPSFISDEEFQTLKKHKNIPLGLLDFHSNDIKELKKKNSINEYQQIQLDQTIVNLCSSMGKTERIKKTVFPTTYRLTLHIFIYTFLILLSLSLTELHSLVEIPLEILISIPFFMLEKIALSIQDPFENNPTDTPTTAISKTIETNLKQLIGDENLPGVEGSDNFYVL
jgi:putative membrane protein